ncbi:MAG: hypothetical protein ACP5J4_09215 [Anaerolineae bacterium]
MRRNSLHILLSMLMLLVVITGLLCYIFLRSSTDDTVATGTVVPATLPVSPEQQNTLLSEPTSMPVRLVYIISILVVFVSAVLILLRMLLGISGKNEG